MTGTIGAIVSSPRKLGFTLLSGKLTLGAAGVCSNAAAPCDYVGRLGQSTLPFSLMMLKGPGLPWGSLCPNSSGEEHGSHNNSAFQSRSSLQKGNRFDVVPGPDWG